MKVKVPAQEYEACDTCHRGGYLQTCKACGGRYCIICHALVSGCIHAMDICRKCSDRPEVLAISKAYAPKILAVLDARDVELAKLKDQKK